MSSFERLRVAWANPWVRWPVNVLCLVLMVPMLIWLSAWGLSRDEPLLEDVQALMRLQIPVQDPGNAYWDVLGLGTPADQEVHVAAAQLAGHAFDRYSLGDGLESLRLIDAVGEALFAGPWQGACQEAQAACISEMRAHAGAVQAWLSEHALQWQRLRQAMQRPRWEDWDVDAGRMAKRLADASALVRAEAMIDWLNGQRAQALALTERSLWLCRRALAGTVMLEVKAAAQRCAARAWALASAMVIDASDDLLASEEKTLAMMMLGFHPDEWSLRALVKDRMRKRLPQLFDNEPLHSKLYSRSVWLRVLAKPFLLPNATMNRHFDEAMSEAAALDRMPGAQLMAYRRPQRARDLWSWLRTGNPVGMWILSVQAKQEDPLAKLRLEIRALEGQRRLYALVWACRREKKRLAAADAQGLASCAASAPEALRNPFDGSTASWDDAERVLRLPIPAGAGVESDRRGDYTPQLRLPG